MTNYRRLMIEEGYCNHLSIHQYGNLQNLDELTATNVPKDIRLNKDLDLPPALDEHRMLRELREISKMNKV